MAGGLPVPRQACLRTLRSPSTADPIDQALVLLFLAPASFTGEDVVELHIHGGPAVISRVLQELGALPSLRLAEPGEFTRRAFENGRLDLTEVEGLADLIAAETEQQRRQALAQADGALSRLYESWRARLIEATALAEAAIDFSDEGDVARDAEALARSQVAVLSDAIARHLDDGHRGELVRDGFQVVLAGPTNAGKSSLLNALARRDVAIVSDEAGTTRDIIEVKLDLEGLPIVVSDTAGIREAAGKVAACAHQIHGAIGFTSEHALHRFTRRLWAWREQGGSDGYWYDRIGRAALAAGRDGLWPGITNGFDL